MLYVEEKYLKQIGSRLPRFQYKGNHTYQCRCVLCGDSAKKKTKCRGYFYAKVGKLMYACHNCGVSIQFRTFLRDFDPNIFKQYSMEMFKDKMSREITKDIAQLAIPKTVKYVPDIFEDLPLVRNLDEKSQEYLFCAKRCLPIEAFDFYFAEKFIEWSKGNTDKFSSWKSPDHPRIVIPWYDRNKKIIGYSARALDDLQEQKYYRIFVDDACKERFFGLDRVNEKKQIYVLEGEIDSLMIPNAIAVANGKLQQYMNKEATYIPDCDVRNKHIMKNVRNMVDLGLKVCMLPDDLPGKDLNDMVKMGLSADDVVVIINDNTFQGLEAQLKFTLWSKV